MNAHEELQRFAERSEWAELVRYAQEAVAINGSEHKAPWGTSGWDPLDRPELDTLAGLAHGFIEWRKSHPWGKNDRWPPASDNTIVGYKNVLKAPSHPKLKPRYRLADRHPAKLTRADVAELSSQLQAVVSRDLATRCVDLVRQVLEWACLVQGLLSRNVAQDLRGPGRSTQPEDTLNLWDSAGDLRSKPIGAFTPAELQDVLRAAYEYDMAFGIFAEASVRMARLGEAAALDKNNGFVISANGKHAEIIIWGGMAARQGGGFVSTPGKHIGGSGEVVSRSIPIPVSFYHRVEEWKQSDEYKIRSRLKGNPKNLLLLNRLGNPFTTSTWRKLPERVYPAAGFDEAELQARRLTANSLRHSGITSAVLNGDSPEMIAENAGNSAEMIRRVYFRPTKDQLEDIALRLIDFEL